MSLILDGSAGVTFPNSTVQASAGSVLQVVSANSTGQQTTTSTSFVATNLTATITPKFSTSKILVMYFVPVTNVTAGTQVYHNIYRNNSTQLLNGVNGQNVYELNGTGYTWITAACSVYDSPATTSATTYTVYQKTTGGTAYFNYGASMPNIIYLMEIAA